jgi:hypothetical protein
MKKDDPKTEKLATPAKDEQKKKDKKWKSQDEFDDKSHERLRMESEISNASQNQKRKDSQEGDERKIPASHKKQTQQDWRTNKKEPNIKK